MEYFSEENPYIDMVNDYVLIGIATIFRRIRATYLDE